MEIFLDIPHLPQGKVRKIILGEKYRKVLGNALLTRNLQPIWLKCNKNVDERLSGHCDLMAAHLGGRHLAVLEDKAEQCERINNIELLKIKAPEKPDYPHDAKLNFCIVGDKLIYNPKTADEAAVACLNKVPAACKQGYTKCSVCVVDESSIITADAGIAQIAEGVGIDVLFVDEKITALDGFEHGFIGGASFKISRNEMAFTGVINDAAQKLLIESFLNERGISAVYLTEHTLFDIGSAIPITEEI